MSINRESLRSPQVVDEGGWTSADALRLLEKALKMGGTPNCRVPPIGGPRAVEALGDRGAQGKANALLKKFGGSAKGGEKHQSFKNLPDFTTSAGKSVARVEDRSSVPDAKMCSECGQEVRSGAVQ